MLDQKFAKVNSIDHNVLLEKRPKHQEDSVTLILTFHPVLHVIFDILKSAHRHTEKSFITIGTTKTTTG